MKTDQFGRMIFAEPDLVDLIMQGRDLLQCRSVMVDQSVDIGAVSTLLVETGQMNTWQCETEYPGDTKQFDAEMQSNWYMPANYQTLDIAEHVLSLCNTPEQLQRVGQELLLYQERNLFNLLRYLKYLVDVMTQNHIIWGVGRGSSVASYVLYLLKVHRIDSLYYDLDPTEFLR